jgi:hypothetical protein
MSGNDVITIDIPEVVKWIGYLTAFGGVIGLLWKPVKKLKDFFEKLNSTLDFLVKETTEQGLAIKRLTVYNEQLPLSERISAGKAYIAQGGNGDVKHYIMEHLLPYDKVKEEN